MSETGGKKGLLIVISGFSGAGKSTLTKKMLETCDGYAYSVSATTRSPRAGEQDGRDYFFIKKEEFMDMIENDALLEYNCYVGNYYGTPKSYVLSQMEKGKDVILEIDVNGAFQVKKSFPEAVLVFVTAPSASVLKDRLEGRGTEDAETVKKRLTQTLREADQVQGYDYLIVNDDLSETVRRLDRLIRDQHLRTSASTAYIETFKKEIRNFI